MPCWRVSLLERNRFTGAKWDVVGRNLTTFPIALNGNAKQSRHLISISSNHPIHNIKKYWKRFYYRLSTSADDKFIFWINRSEVDEKKRRMPIEDVKRKEKHFKTNSRLLGYILINLLKLIFFSLEAIKKKFFLKP